MQRAHPYYLGIVRYKGELLLGQHERIASQELFDRVQEVLEERNGRGQRDRVHFHYLKGILFCQRCRDSGRLGRLIYT